MKRGDFNQRVQKMISISQKNIEGNDLDLFFKRMNLLTKQYGFTKGDYEGAPNMSLLFIYLVENEYKKVFGNSNPSNNPTNQFEIVRLNEIKEDINNKFYKNIKRYGNKRMLLRDMSKYFLEVYSAIEQDYKKKVRDLEKGGGKNDANNLR